MRAQVATTQLSLGLDDRVYCIYCRHRAGQFVDGRYECRHCGERTLFSRREYADLLRTYGPEAA
jgi:DNA-directed RNA polymerase subunit RPC12/RpoP